MPDDPPPDVDVDIDADVDDVARWIVAHDFDRVALQLPDDALPRAASLVRALDAAVRARRLEGETELCVLADTTFGSCCVDEVAASHRGAKAVVHYGRACCSPTSRVPARFVFDKRAIDVKTCARALRAHARMLGGRDAGTSPRCVVAVADQAYAHATAALREELGRDGAAASVVEIVIAESTTLEVDPRRDGAIETRAVDEGRERVGSASFERPPGVATDACAFVWIGGAGPSMTHAMLVLGERAERFGGVAQYDPEVDDEVRVEADGSSEAARALKRRRFLIAKAKEANVVGIVAGTLGVAGYREMIANLRKMIANSGRKSYTIVAGKPNPQKLANFPEIEVYIMVSCELTALMDSRDYLQPIITPYEASIAFTSGKMWMGEVKLDFASVPKPDDASTSAGDDGDAGEPEFSLISGSLDVRNPVEHARAMTEEDTDAPNGLELARRAEDALALRASGAAAAVVTSGAEYLMSRRTYVGLEPGPKRDEETGELADAPLEAARGLSGRAAGYSDERAS